MRRWLSDRTRTLSVFIVLVLALVLGGLVASAQGVNRGQGVYRPVTEGSTGTGTTATLGAGQSRNYNTVSIVIDRTFASQSRIVRLLCSTNCFIAFGTTNTTQLVATAATGTFLPENVTHYFKVSPGQTAAVIRSATDGTLFVSEMTK